MPPALPTVTLAVLPLTDTVTLMPFVVVRALPLTSATSVPSMRRISLPPSRRPLTLRPMPVIDWPLSPALMTTSPNRETAEPFST